MHIRAIHIKSSLAIITVFVILLSFVPGKIFANNSTSFTDTQGHWASKEIENAFDKGLLNGISDSKFNPEGSVTRAMFITVVHRLVNRFLDSPEVRIKEQTFTDVPANAWYLGSIKWAVNVRLTEGYGNGAFGPNDVLSREQIAVLLIRFLEKIMGYNFEELHTDFKFSDDDQISDWAKEAVYKAVALGLIQGETETTFNPKGVASRAVVAVAITGIFNIDKTSDVREKTFNVNRGVGRVDALLKAKNSSDEDYYASHKANLYGNASTGNYYVHTYSSFDSSIYNEDSNTDIDYSKYDIFNVVLTPFAGESYSGKTVSATAYYTDANNTKQTLTLTTTINNKGKLIIANTSSQAVESLNVQGNDLYIEITVTVNGVSQPITLQIRDIYRTTPINGDFVEATTWSEVLTLLNTHNNVNIYYIGDEDINVTSKMVINPTQRLTISNDKNLTINSGGEVSVEGSVDNGANLHVNGNLTIRSGGKLTTNSQLPSQGTSTTTGVSATGKITIEEGSEINIPEYGKIYLFGSTDGIEITEGAVVTNKGLLSFLSNVIINGEVNTIGKNFSKYPDSSQGCIEMGYYDVTVNGKFTVTDNGSITSEAFLTLGENGEMELIKGNATLSNKVYNDGKLTVKDGEVTFSDVNYPVNNYGIIELTSSSKMFLNGAVLVNMGEFNGTGTVHLVEAAYASSNYDNGISNVVVLPPNSPSLYSRNIFYNEPAKTVVATIKESKLYGPGTVQGTIRINKITLPE